MKEWTQQPDEISDDGMISADAISDLCTTDNCISTWYVGERGEDEVKKGVLALTSGFRSLDEIKIVFLDTQNLIDADLTIDETDGKTRIEEYAKLHRDISLLDVSKLQKLAKIILENVWAENTEVIHKETIVLWLLWALNERKVKFDSLDKNLRQGLASSINKMIRQNKINKEHINDDVLASIEQQLEQNSRKTNCKFENICDRYPRKYKKN